MQKLFVIVFVILVVGSSCIQNKQLVYLKDIDKESFYPKKQDFYQIQAQDVLYINITSINAEINELFSNIKGSTQQTTMFQSEAGIYINGYVVNDSGYISLPTIGEVYLLNQSLDEAKNTIKEKTRLYLKDAMVDVKLISFKFTVLGEVNKPGVYRNYNNQLTVFEAIGMAGDVSVYGNRKKILVMRPLDDGTKTYRIDLTDKSILTSEAFYLKPNDTVYIEPIKSKLFQVNSPNISLLFSTITTVLLIINFINTSNNKG